MESNAELVSVLLSVLREIVGYFSAEDYAQYLNEELFKEGHLLEWMVAVQPDFDTFTFVELATFQSIQKDYFQVVFRPANEVEWDTFCTQKSDNLT